MLAQSHRKAETRAKIALGGLVRKAGLGEEPSNVLLGLLLEAREQLAGPDGELIRRRWQRRGASAFEAEAEAP